MEKEIVEIKTKNKTKMEFNSMQLDTFWCAQHISTVSKKML